MKLKNKKIVVFGGTSGIGLETIKLLLQNGASKVYAISRNPKKVKIRKKQLVLEKADVLDESSLKAVFKRIGKYDVLVSTATGGERAIGPFLSLLWIQNADFQGRLMNSFCDRGAVYTKNIFYWDNQFVMLRSRVGQTTRVRTIAI